MIEDNGIEKFGKAGKAPSAPLWQAEADALVAEYVGESPEKKREAIEWTKASFCEAAAAFVRASLLPTPLAQALDRLCVFDTWDEWLSGAVNEAMDDPDLAEDLRAYAELNGEAGDGALFDQALGEAVAAARAGAPGLDDLVARAGAPEPEVVEVEAAASPIQLPAVIPVALPAVIESPSGRRGKGPTQLTSLAPRDIARQFVNDRYWIEVAGMGGLQFWQLAFWHWSGDRWQLIDPETMRSAIYDYTDKAEVRRDGSVTVLNPEARKVGNILDALQALVNINREVAMPGWLGSAVPPPVENLRELIPCANGLLDIRTRSLFAHSPRFWSANVFDFAYDPNARAPRFEQFLEELWPGDPETQEAVLQMIGVCLTDETRYQKIWMFVGPKRGGRGTMGRLIEGLLGEGNYLATSFESFGEPFGLESFVGKKVVVFSDATVDGIDYRVMSKIVGRLKTISGQDKQHINRKNKTYYDGKLGCRMITFSNELLAFRDDSGALATRMITIEMLQSFYGREDKNLTEKLLAERSGILNLALDALARIPACPNAEPIQPRSGRAMGEDLTALTSDAVAFIADLCVVGPGEEVSAEKLFSAWEAWCERSGIRWGWRLQQFTAKIRAAAGAPITSSRPRTGKSRKTRLHGIGLRRNE
jgi:putative DNA primase/helicase